MAVRATQAIIASLSIANLAYTQATQIVVNALANTQQHVLATQLFTDTLTNVDTHVRATQFLADALTNIATHVRATQISLSVLVWNHAVGVGAAMPSIYPTLPGLTYSVIKRPKWYTGVGTAATGREVRVAYAQNPLWEWDLTYNYLPDEQTEASATPSDIKQLIGFYLAMAGSFQSFLFLDPDDNAVSGQVIGTTDGINTTWTLARTYGGSDGTGSEPVGYINTNLPFNVYLGGTLADPSTYTLLATVLVNQQIRFNSAPTTGQIVTVDMSYYYVARFSDDHYDFEKFMDRLWSVGKLTLMSQRG